MDYREYDVPTALQRHVRCLWRLCDPAPSTGAQTIYPDGHCELIIHLKQPMRAYHPERGWHVQAQTLFAAQHRSAIRLAALGPMDCVGVRLQPTASAVIAGASLPQLRDQIVDLSALNAECALHLFNAATQFASHAISSHFWQALESMLLPFPIDARIESAVTRLQSEHGRNRIEPMASEVAMSLRAFQSRFLACVGLNPKEFARVQRLQGTLQMLDSGIESLSQIALESGFSDQAHATRELHRLTGLTPARLLDALRNHRDGDHTIRLAAAFVRGYTHSP